MTSAAQTLPVASKKPVAGYVLTGLVALFLRSIQWGGLYLRERRLRDLLPIRR